MQHLTIELDLPTSKPIPPTLQNDVRNAAVIYLYKQGTLSMLEAAKLIGCNRRDFEESLVPKYGYTMMDERDLVSELDVINQHI
ncbi:MAG: UPF0175 family protein [Methylococcales bacterium]